MSCIIYHLCCPHLFLQVLADKEREVLAGHDGTWVAHPDLVKVALNVFNK